VEGRGERHRDLPAGVRSKRGSAGWSRELRIKDEERDTAYDCHPERGEGSIHTMMILK